ncbi:amidohydrolase [Seiridium cupressi]
MLREGFTTARDCGGADSSLKEAIAEWLIPGPRLLITGHALSQTGGHGDQRSFFNDEDPTLKFCAGQRSGIGRICDGATECSIAVQDAIRKGADFITIMGGGGVASRLNNLGHPQFLLEEIRLPGDAAHDRQRSPGHIEHGDCIDRELALEMAEREIFFTPTLVTYDALRTAPYDQFLNEQSAEKNMAVLKSGLDAISIAADAGNITWINRLQTDIIENTAIESEGNPEAAEQLPWADSQLPTPDFDHIARQQFTDTWMNMFPFLSSITT